MNFSHKGRNVFATLIVLILAGASVTDAAMSYGVGTRGSKGVYVVDFDTPTSVSQLFPTPDIGWYGATDGDDSDTFFATPYGGSLYRVDVVNMTVTAIGSYGDVAITGLAYDEDNETLYATDYANLYTVGIGTGIPVLIGSLGGPSQTWALDYDPSIGEDGELVGISQSYRGSMLFHIDRGSGSVTPKGYVHLGSGECVRRITDIWYDAESELMYGVSNDPLGIGVGKLYSINSTTGQAEFLGRFCDDLLGLGAPTVPEPATIILFGLGGMVFLRKRAA